MDLNIIAGYVSLGIVITREIVTAINHKRCKSMCCNKVITSSIDIENTTPESNGVSKPAHLSATAQVPES